MDENNGIPITRAGFKSLRMPASRYIDKHIVVGVGSHPNSLHHPD